MSSAIHSPTIVNGTDYTIVVFQERGTLYNRQVLLPGEAVTMTRKQTSAGLLLPLPYKVHAVIGDESALPTKWACFTHLAKVSIIPAAFIVGCLMSASSGGTMAGPSAALTRMVSGMVVKGVVIDSAALAAGTLMASRAKMISNLLLRKQKDKFMCVTPLLNPGERYLMVKGGLTEGSITIEDIPKKQLNQVRIKAMKRPMDFHEEPAALADKESTHYHYPPVSAVVA
jgi:hypothetical protein